MYFVITGYNNLYAEHALKWDSTEIAACLGTMMALKFMNCLFILGEWAFYGHYL